MPPPVVRDLLVAPFLEGDSWGSLDLTLVPEQPRPGASVDLATAAGPDALRQALLLRLLTPVGALAALGHPDYGSRLHELVGELHTPAARQLARSYVLRALEQEPRIRCPLQLDLEAPDPATPDRLRIHVVVEARDLTDPVALSIEVAP
jgi:phage baseplate assembly protein W